MSVEWETEITHDGMWPLKWQWKVRRRNTSDYHSDLRLGSARTKERAQRAAVKARLSIERETLRIVEVD